MEMGENCANARRIFLLEVASLRNHCLMQTQICLKSVAGQQEARNGFKHFDRLPQNTSTNLQWRAQWADGFDLHAKLESDASV